MPVNGSLNLQSVKEIYRELILLTSCLIDKLHNTSSRREIVRLNGHLQSVCVSSALISWKFGSAIQYFIRDLQAFINQSIQDLEVATDRRWVGLVGTDSCFAYQDQQIKEMGVAVPVIAMTVLKSLTGQWKEPVSQQMFPDVPKNDKKKNQRSTTIKRMNRLVKHLKSMESSGNEPAKLCHSAFTALPSIDLLHEMSDEEVASLVSHTLQTGVSVFGPIIGARIGLRYTEAVFHIARELLQQSRRGEMKPIQWHRLQERTSRLLSLSRDYQLVHRSTLSGMHLESPGGVAEEIDEEDLRKRNVLRYDMLEQLGVLLADALASTPGVVLQTVMAVCAADFDEHLTLTSSLQRPVTAAVESHNLNKVQLKVAEFENFLASVEEENDTKIMDALGMMPTQTTVENQQCHEPTPGKPLYKSSWPAGVTSPHDTTSSHNVLAKPLSGNISMAGHSSAVDTVGRRTDLVGKKSYTRLRESGCAIGVPDGSCRHGLPTETDEQILEKIQQEKASSDMSPKKDHFPVANHEPVQLFMDLSE